MNNIGLTQLVTSPAHCALHTLDPIVTSSDGVKYRHVTHLDRPCHCLIKLKHPLHHSPDPLTLPTSHPAPLTTAGVKYQKSNGTEALNIFHPQPHTKPGAWLQEFLSLDHGQRRPRCPIKPSRCKRPTKQASWYILELKTTKRNCKQLKQKWRSSKEQADRATYKKTLNLYHQLLKETKKKAQADYI